MEKPIIEKSIRGNLKFLVFNRFYGFITRFDTKEDIFVHGSEIRYINPAQFTRRCGDSVIFDLAVGAKGIEAVNVVLNLEEQDDNESDQESIYLFNNYTGDYEKIKQGNDTSDVNIKTGLCDDSDYSLSDTEINQQNNLNPNQMKNNETLSMYSSLLSLSMESIYSEHTKPKQQSTPKDSTEIKQISRENYGKYYTNDETKENHQYQTKYNKKNSIRNYEKSMKGNTNRLIDIYTNENETYEDIDSDSERNENLEETNNEMESIEKDIRKNNEDEINKDFVYYDEMLKGLTQMDQMDDKFEHETINSRLCNNRNRCENNFETKIDDKDNASRNTKYGMNIFKDNDDDVINTGLNIRYGINILNDKDNAIINTRFNKKYRMNICNEQYEKIIDKDYAHNEICEHSNAFKTNESIRLKMNSTSHELLKENVNTNESIYYTTGYTSSDELYKTSLFISNKPFKDCTNNNQMNEKIELRGKSYRKFREENMKKLKEIGEL